MKDLYLHEELLPFFPDQQNRFDQIMKLPGKIYRSLEGRCTQRIQLGNQTYFIKQHHGIGWKEIFKNVLQGRLPITGARNEWRAIQALAKKGLDVPVIMGFGQHGCNPATLKSFLITRELPKHTSLEDFCKTWREQPPRFRLKQTLIKEVARIARVMHSSGINHRDFYICHFLLTQQGIVYLIDLHRAQIRKHIPLRWQLKDLAGLYFSSKDIGLTQRDLLRFMKSYQQKTLREMQKDFAFWQQVKKRGDRIREK